MLSLLKPLVWEPGPAKLAALATGADRPMSAAVPTASAKARFLTDMLGLPPLNRMILHAESALLFVFKRLPYRTINGLGGMFESTRRRFSTKFCRQSGVLHGVLLPTITECRRNATILLTGEKPERLAEISATDGSRHPERAHRGGDQVDGAAVALDPALDEQGRRV